MSWSWFDARITTTSPPANADGDVWDAGKVDHSPKNRIHLDPAMAAHPLDGKTDWRGAQPR